MSQAAACLHWPVARLRAQLRLIVPEIQVQILAEVGSTNSALKNRARDGQTEPVLLVAERQTAGRGQRGRNWQAGAPGDVLTFSLGLSLACEDLSGLSLAVGVAVAESLHPDIRIKWPNDLWWQQGKLAGILIETAAVRKKPGMHVIVGIGLNIRQTRQNQARFRNRTSHLQALLPAVDAPMALFCLAAPLVQAMLDFERHGLAFFAARFAQRDLLLGRCIRLQDGRQGQVRGINAQGALQLETRQGMQTIYSGSIAHIGKPEINAPGH